MCLSERIFFCDFCCKLKIPLPGPLPSAIFFSAPGSETLKPAPPPPAGRSGSTLRLNLRPSPTYESIQDFFSKYRSRNIKEYFSCFSGTACWRDVLIAFYPKQSLSNSRYLLLLLGSCSVTILPWFVPNSNLKSSTLSSSIMTSLHTALRTVVPSHGANRVFHYFSCFLPQRLQIPVCHLGKTKKNILIPKQQLEQLQQ